MSGVSSGRARSWFWILTAIALLAMGALHRALQAPRALGEGLAALGSSLVLVASLVPANWIRTALTGCPRPLRQLLHLAGKAG